MAKNGTVQDIDLGYKSFVATVKKLRPTGPDVLVGLIGSDAEATHTDGDAELTNAAIGVIHEFGVDEPPVKIPQRSWLRKPFDDNRRKYEILLIRLTRSILLAGKGMTMERALGIVGLVAEQDIRDAIREGIAPPLADATIEGRIQKEGDTSFIPLIDTAQFIQSITHLVVPDGEKISVT